jgi:hypothetical protein
MGKRKALVTEYLENVSRGVLARYRKIVRRYSHRRQGVYALYRKGQLYYVGLATNLRGRLGTHGRDRHGTSWDRFSVYLTVGDEHLRELEALLIRIANPKGNRQVGKFAKAENLRRRFKKDVRTRMAEETLELLGDGRGLAGRPRRRSVVRGAGSKTAFTRLAHRPSRLRADYKGRILRAKVLADGRIRFNGSVFSSPSKAASIAIGRPCNGWWFWKFERTPGQWERLRELRK